MTILRQTTEPIDHPLVWVTDGVEYCLEEDILALFLTEGILFPGCNGPSVSLYINCNDVFAWACADAEPLPFSEIANLYKAYLADQQYGVIKWCCLKRNLRPQTPIVRQMKEAGAWDDTMELLPKPELS